MTATLEMTMAIVREMDDSALCAICNQWHRAGSLIPVNGSIDDKIFHPENRGGDIPQTIWVCPDCYDLNN